MDKIKKRKLVVGRDGNCCIFCKTSLHFSEITLDHIIPQKYNGPDCVLNLTVACAKCNSNRHHTDFFEYYRKYNPSIQNINKFKLLYILSCLRLISKKYIKIYGSKVWFLTYAKNYSDFFSDEIKKFEKFGELQFLLRKASSEKYLRYIPRIQNMLNINFETLLQNSSEQIYKTLDLKLTNMVQNEI